jgi:hypothetical protein
VRELAMLNRIDFRIDSRKSTLRLTGVPKPAMYMSNRSSS